MRLLHTSVTETLGTYQNLNGGGHFLRKKLYQKYVEKSEKIRKKISEYNKAFRRDDYIYIYI